MKIGIIVAMQQEFELVAQSLNHKTEQDFRHIHLVEGQLHDKDIVVMKSGMGKVNAAIVATEMINHFHPDYIINTGIAGGLDKSLSVMDVVIGKETTYHDVWCGEGEYGQVQFLPAKYKADDKLLKASEQVKTDLKIHFGLGVSGDQFISDLAELQKIKKQFPEALSVDMESGAIAQVCYLYKTPFLAVRLISDTPGIENHYNQYLDFWSLAPEKSFDVLKQIIQNL